MLWAALRTLSGWQGPRSSQGNLLQHGLARKQTSLFLLEPDSRNQVFPPSTLPPVHQVQGQPGALPLASTAGPGQSEPGSQLRQSPLSNPHVSTHPRDPCIPPDPLQGPRVHRAGPAAVSQEAKQKWIEYCPGNNKGRAHAEIYLY